MKRFTAALLGLSALLLLSSCNTWIGMTRDLQMVGKNMENKAEGVVRGDNDPEYQQQQYGGYDYGAPQQPAY